jgi:bile acid-coenzyme A ligase
MIMILYGSLNAPSPICARIPQEGHVSEFQSYASRIGQLASERPDDPVLRMILLSGSEPVYTWAELHRRSSQVAAALAGRGLGHGDRIALRLRNSLELVLSVFAAWKLGAVPVPVRWDLPEWELERLHQVIEPKVALTTDDLSWLCSTAALEVPSLPDAVSPQENGLCSGGSTGLPKVILHSVPSRYDPQTEIPFMERWMAVPRPETILVPTALYHGNGFNGLRNLLAGNRLLILERFDAARMVDVIERYRVTNFTATPTMLQRIADLPGVDDRDLSSLVWILQGAAPMPPSLVDRWAALIGAERILMVYGMTEGLGLTAIRGDEWMKQRGSVGRPFGGTELRILDTDGKGVKNGGIGEIYMRSSMGPGEYLGNVPGLQRTPDGFSTVGDLGYVDDEGYLYFADRRVDMIVTGGANVFPAEVEAALIDHPKIADVVVMGLKDSHWGRRVHAVVQPIDSASPPSPQEVIDYAKSRVAAYKAPKTVELVETLLRSEATKVNRRALIDARGG